MGDVVEDGDSVSADGKRTAAKLAGRVVKLTFKQRKDGAVRHWTRIEFEPDAAPYRSVALSGTIPAGNDPETTLLVALTHRYALADGLPEPRWV